MIFTGSLSAGLSGLRFRSRMLRSFHFWPRIQMRLLLASSWKQFCPMAVSSHTAPDLFSSFCRSAMTFRKCCPSRLPQRSGGFCLFVCFNLNCELQNNLKSSFPTSLTPNSPKPFIHSPWPLVEAGKYSSILQNTVHWTVTPEAIF